MHNKKYLGKKQHHTCIKAPFKGFLLSGNMGKHFINRTTSDKCKRKGEFCAQEMFNMLNK